MPEECTRGSERGQQAPRVNYGPSSRSTKYLNPIWALSAAKRRRSADAHNRAICGDDLLPVRGWRHFRGHASGRSVDFAECMPRSA
jgi:hypothetical protein